MIPTLKITNKWKYTFNIRLYSSVCCALTEYEEWIILNKLQKRSSGDYLHLRNAPWIHVSQPGKCPKCGMALIKERHKRSKKQHKVNNSKPASKGSGTNKIKTVGPNCQWIAHTRIILLFRYPLPQSSRIYFGKSSSRTVRYDLYVRDTIDFQERKRAIAVNGQIQCQL
jgi:hypothetical protein